MKPNRKPRDKRKSNKFDQRFNAFQNWYKKHVKDNGLKDTKKLQNDLWKKYQESEKYVPAKDKPSIIDGDFTKRNAPDQRYNFFLKALSKYKKSIGIKSKWSELRTLFWSEFKNSEYFELTKNTPERILMYDFKNKTMPPIDKPKRELKLLTDSEVVWFDLFTLVESWLAGGTDVVLNNLMPQDKVVIDILSFFKFIEKTKQKKASHGELTGEFSDYYNQSENGTFSFGDNKGDLRSGTNEMYKILAHYFNRSDIREEIDSPPPYFEKYKEPEYDDTNDSYTLFYVLKIRGIDTDFEYAKETEKPEIKEPEKIDVEDIDFENLKDTETEEPEKRIPSEKKLEILQKQLDENLKELKQMKDNKEITAKEYIELKKDFQREFNENLLKL